MEICLRIFVFIYDLTNPGMGKVRYVLTNFLLKGGTTSKRWFNAHNLPNNIEARSGCCAEDKTKCFLDVEDSGNVAVLMEDVDLEVMVEYFKDMGHRNWAQKTVVYVIPNNLPVGLPPHCFGCMPFCLTCIAPIHGHFIAQWQMENTEKEVFERWNENFHSESQSEMRNKFEQEITIFRAMKKGEENFVLGLAADCNYKEVMAYISSLKLFLSIPEKRRSGEVEVMFFDGGKTRKDVNMLSDDILKRSAG